MSLARAALAAALLTACRGAKGHSGVAGIEAPPGQGAQSVAASHAAPPVFASSGARCGECHGALAAEWRRSAHARSEQTPTYVAMRAKVNAADCDECHGPVTRLLRADDPAAGDGVDCDACHTLAETSPRRSGAGFVLRLDDTTQYGPLCDAKNNYFHKVQCSVFHSRAEMCGSCHWMWTAGPPGQELPLLTEYEEWRDSRYGGIGVTCQDCHMPGESMAVAVGARRRDGVARHDFGTADTRFRASALAVRVRVEPLGAGRLAVHAALRNAGAGHDVPTGFPGRRLVLRATTFDSAGRPVDESRRSYGRVLVDADGAPAPFYAAAHVLEDTRIHVDEQRDEVLEVRATAAAEVRVEVAWQAMAPDIAARLSVSPGEVVLLRGSAKLDGRIGRRPSPIAVTMDVVP